MGTVERRTFLLAAAGTGAALGLAACGAGAASTSVGTAAITPRATARTGSGATRRLVLRAQPIEVDLGGTIVATWAYGSTIPGRAFHATAGDRVIVDFRNDLPEPTSVHWHGLAIRNDMDGVPGVTTPETAPGGRSSFDFVVPDPGTHWFHPHHGLQLDHGLYAPFVIDDPDEPGDYDAEWVIVLDDWTDGVGPDATEIMAGLVAAGESGDGMAGMGMGMDHGMGGMGGMGMDGGDVTYPFYLVNGRVPSDPETFVARAGDRIRLRIINAAADTVFTVALGGHDLVVTHSDGYPVQPVATPALRIGMGERYDAVVTLGDGVFAFAAAPDGKKGLARALVRSGSGSVPMASARPAELAAYPLTVDALRAAESARLPERDPDTVQDVLLSGSMAPYVWTINGTTYQDTIPLTIREGQAGRLSIRNMSMMSHPVHVHGHTFQMGSAGGSGPRKDTVLVPPMGGYRVDLVADNPGKWMVHCHNAYHADAGMMTRLEYVA
ncbi:MAG: multicopper oxidase family protein [Actinomycetota bacterium]|nr:multicopper oxidase family protein [Actinomycetota bacterium]